MSYRSTRRTAARDMLMEECGHMMQQTLCASPWIKRSRSAQRAGVRNESSGPRKREKKEEKEVGSGEIIMRILRVQYIFFLPLTISGLKRRDAQTEHNGLHCAAVADTSYGPGRTGAARAPTAETEVTGARCRCSRTGCPSCA